MYRTTGEVLSYYDADTGEHFTPEDFHNEIGPDALIEWKDNGLVRYAMSTPEGLQTVPGGDIERVLPDPWTRLMEDLYGDSEMTVTPRSTGTMGKNKGKKPKRYLAPTDPITLHYDAKTGNYSISSRLLTTLHDVAESMTSPERKRAVHAARIVVSRVVSETPTEKTSSMKTDTGTVNHNTKATVVSVLKADRSAGVFDKVENFAKGMETEVGKILKQLKSVNGKQLSNAISTFVAYSMLTHGDEFHRYLALSYNTLHDQANRLGVRRAAEARGLVQNLRSSRGMSAASSMTRNLAAIKLAARGLAVISETLDISRHINSVLTSANKLRSVLEGLPKVLDAEFKRDPSEYTLQEEEALLEERRAHDQQLTALWCDYAWILRKTCESAGATQEEVDDLLLLPVDCFRQDGPIDSADTLTAFRATVKKESSDWRKTMMQFLKGEGQNVTELQPALVSNLQAGVRTLSTSSTKSSKNKSKKSRAKLKRGEQQTRSKDDEEDDAAVDPDWSETNQYRALVEGYVSRLQERIKSQRETYKEEVRIQRERSQKALDSASKEIEKRKIIAASTSVGERLAAARREGTTLIGSEVDQVISNHKESRQTSSRLVQELARRLEGERLSRRLEAAQSCNERLRRAEQESGYWGRVRDSRWAHENPQMAADGHARPSRPPVFPEQIDWPVPDATSPSTIEAIRMRRARLKSYETGRRFIWPRDDIKGLRRGKVPQWQVPLSVFSSKEGHNGNKTFTESTTAIQMDELNQMQSPSHSYVGPSYFSDLSACDPVGIFDLSVGNVGVPYSELSPPDWVPEFDELGNLICVYPDGTRTSAPIIQPVSPDHPFYNDMTGNLLDDMDITAEEITSHFDKHGEWIPAPSDPISETVLHGLIRAAGDKRPSDRSRSLPRRPRDDIEEYDLWTSIFAKEDWPGAEPLRPPLRQRAGSLDGSGSFSI